MAATEVLVHALTAAAKPDVTGSASFLVQINS